MKRSKTRSLAHDVAALSAFVKAAGKTLINGLGHTAAERQIARLESGRMRLWACHVRLYLDDDIALGLQDFVADIQVDDPELPLIPERTDQFTFEILQGAIRLEEAAIAAILDRYLLSTGALPLCRPKVALDENGLRLDAELTWGPLRVPIRLAGPVTLRDDGSIALEVDRIEAAGLGLGPLLHALRSNLEHVIRLPPDSPVEACGNQIALDPERLFPAPRTKGRPVSLKMARGALVLTYDWPEPLEDPPLIQREANAFLFCLGHTLLVGKMALNDAVFQIVPRSQGTTELDFSLMQYRQQLAAGESTLSQREEVLVRLPNLA
ncbi:MAG: hypothetical protein KGR26_11205, partial [Cyanobacteria bacterium REEB65]|nr:hypothetical protein [Cyanobacteria bacterium REEB65]